MKNFIRLSVFFILTAIFLTGCNITIEDEYKLASPTCDIDAGNCISISLKKYSTDTEYINIYRQDVTREDYPGEILSIGLIYPKKLSDEVATNTFKDFLVKKGHTYRYYARIFDGKEYTKTEWSNSVEIPATSNCYDNSDNLTYNTRGVEFSYRKDDHTFTVNGNITLPDASFSNFTTEYLPAIILETSSNTEAFILPDISDGAVISIRGIISSKFLDKDIKVVGICGQKTELVEGSDNVKRVIWTDPVEVKIKNARDNTIFIESAGNTEGYNYSRQLNKN